MAVGRGKAQFHDFRAQQTQGPVVVSIRSLRAGDGCDHCDLPCVKLGFGARAGQFTQRSFQAALNKTLSDFQHGGQRDIQSLANLLIGVTFGKFGQDTCAGDHACTVYSFVDEGKKMLLLVIAEFDTVGGCDSWQGSLQRELENITPKRTKENQ